MALHKDTTVNTEKKIFEGQELVDYHNMNLIGDYFLLAGYAIECILKGYLLALLPDLVQDEKRLDEIIIKTHDLCKLCHDCSIELSQEEQDLLNLITRYIKWGKYASPTKVDEMPSPVDPKDAKSKSLRIENPFYQRRVQSLVNGVYQRGFSLLSGIQRSQK